MKKTFFILCAAALTIGMASCKKEKDPAKDYVNPTYVEGVFNPGKHLSTVVGPGMSQQWSWTNTDPKQLTGIADVVNQTSTSYTYKGSGRMATSTYTAQGTSNSYTFGYDEGTLDHLTLRQNGAIAANGSVGYAGGKIAQIDYSDISSSLIMKYASQFSGMNLGDGEIHFESPSFSDSFTWTGENVTAENMVANFSGQIPVSSVVDIAGDMLGSSLGSYAAILIPLLSQYMGDSAFAFTATCNANITYSYDDKYNPYRGYWGEGLMMHPQALSANNPTTVQAQGNMHLDMVISLPQECPDVLEQYATIWAIIYSMVNGRVIGQDYPINFTRTYSYQYNTIGFPTSYTNQDGQTFTLTYAD